MAIYRFAVQILSRAKGRSAVACAAYRAGERLYDERRGRWFSYTNKPGIEHREILAPAGAKEWVFDRERLWNAVERSERRRDSQVAREIQIALPVELSPEQQKKLMRSFLQDEFVARGMVADWALHREDEGNPHAHVMLTLRELGDDGFKQKNRSWNSKRLHRHWREAWEHYANRALADAGRPERIDHRSYADRGVDLDAQPKTGRSSGAAGEDRRDRSADQWDEFFRVAHENGERLLADPFNALAALTSNQATFSRAELLRFTQSKTLGPTQYATCVERVLAHPDLREIPSPGAGLEPRYTTRQVLAREQYVIDTGLALGARRRHRVPGFLVRQAARKRPTLSDDQRAALDYITRATGDLAIIAGYAGTGKSYMLGAAREAWEAEGFVVFGTALAGKAAEGLQQESGIASRTISSWEEAWSHGTQLLTKKHVLVIDEAGMIGTAQMARLIERVHLAGAKMVLVGDVEQLQAIEAGAPLRVLSEKLGSRILSNIRRQRVAWQREASLCFARQKTCDGLQAYAERGLITEHERHADAREAVVAAWRRDQLERPLVEEARDGKTVSRAATSIILTYRRADVRAMNEHARALRHEARELGPDRLLTVRDRDGVQHARAFAVGDRVYFLANHTFRRERDGISVKNGTLGTISRLEGTRLEVLVDGGDALTFDATEYDQFDHGYAATVHKSQGVTVDRGYVLASMPFTSGATYVAMTRHRESLEVHWARDEFQPHWAQPTLGLEEFAGAVVLHQDVNDAFDAALRSWRRSWGDGHPGVLVATTIDDRRALNGYARSLAEEDGRLGERDWVRTLAGSREFAIGDRILITDNVASLALHRGELGTLAQRDGQLLTLAMDDGRSVSLDTREHRGIDYGYAITFEQSRSVQTPAAFVVASERLDELARERLSAPNLGAVTVHGLEAPVPDQEWLFKCLSRVDEQEHALEVSAEAERARRFLYADHRTAIGALAGNERRSYLEQLKAVAERPALSQLEAQLQIPDVCQAKWTVQKAEATLEDRLAARAAVEAESPLAHNEQWSARERASADVHVAERELAEARTRFEALLASPEIEQRAVVEARTHNAQLTALRELHAELDEATLRPEREQRLVDLVARLQQLPDSNFRLATLADYDTELEFRGTEQLNRDRVVVCADPQGARVLFDAARFGSDLSAVRPGAIVQIAPDHAITVRQNLEYEWEYDDE